MWCHGCHVGVAKETKCAKVSVARSMAEQCLVRCEEGQTFAGAPVMEISGGVQSFHPITWWQVCLNEKDTYDIIDSAYGTLNILANSGRKEQCVFVSQVWEKGAVRLMPVQIRGWLFCILQCNRRFLVYSFWVFGLFGVFWFCLEWSEV
jgi:hypothetical protein